MRILKFRYWSNGIRFNDDSGWMFKKGWYSPDQYEFEGMDDPNDIIKYLQKEGILVSQFTGLLDKNGVEIYEGDIVKDNGLKEEFLLTIIWNKKWCSFEGINKKLDYQIPMSDIIIHCEVIGNIYSNPELLTNQ